MSHDRPAERPCCREQYTVGVKSCSFPFVAGKREEKLDSLANRVKVEKETEVARPTRTTCSSGPCPPINRSESKWISNGLSEVQM